MADRFRWDPADLAPSGRPPLLLEPLRLILVVGAVIALAGAAVPWAHGRYSGVAHSTFQPLFEQDGVLLVFSIVLAVVLTLSQNAAESRTRTVQALLGIAGGVAVAAWLSAVQTQDGLLNRNDQIWTAAGDNGLVVSGIGVAILAAAAVALSVDAWRRNGTVQDAADVRLSPRVIARVLVQVVGGVVGLVVGALVALVPFGVYGLIFMVLTAIGGGLTGVAVGDRIARRI